MVDANLRILINAVDKASPQLKGITGALQGIAGSVGGYAIVGAAVTAVADFTRKAVEETQAYNLQMVDLARKMGTTTEEASRLVQVGDDLRISQSAISTAMNYAIRNGIEPSIDGIAKLADQYNALNTPVEKGQLLLKTFGRSGMEMGKLLEKGSQGIKDMADGIKGSLVVTAEAAKASEDYYIAVDELTDAWTTFKMEVGNAVIPVLTDLIDGENDATAATWENVEALTILIARQKQYGLDTTVTTAQLEEMKHQLAMVADAGRWTGLASTFTKSLEDMADGVDVFKAAIGGSFQKEEERFANDMEELTQKTKDIKEEMTKMGATDFIPPENVKKIKSLQSALTGTWMEINKLNEEKKKASDEGKVLDDAQIARLQELQIKAGEYEGKIKGLGGVPYMTPEQAANLEQLHTDLYANTQAIQELEAAHKKATLSMLLDMMIQQSQSNGFTSNEIANISAIAQEWGLWDQASADAFTAVNNNIGLLDLDPATQEAKKFYTEVGRIFTLPSRKDFTFTVTVNQAAGAVFMNGMNIANLTNP